MSFGGVILSEAKNLKTSVILSEAKNLKTLGIRSFADAQDDKVRYGGKFTVSFFADAQDDNRRV